MGLNRGFKAPFERWPNSDAQSDFLQLIAGGNGVIGGIDGTGTPYGTLASGSGSSLFSNLTSGINTSAAMVVGSGASLSATGTGTIVATSSSGSLTLNNVIDAAALGVKANAVYIDDAITTNGGSTIGSAGQATFTPAMVGSYYIMVFPSCSINSIFNNSTTVLLTPITGFIDAQHVSIAPATASAGGSGQCAYYGTLDDAGLTAVDNLLAASQGCPRVQLPAGFMMVSKAHLISNPPGCLRNSANLGAEASGGAGLEIAGYGGGVSQIVPTTSFDFTTCTGGVSGKACFGGQARLNSHDWGINSGGGNLSGVTTNTKTGFEMYCGAYVWNMVFQNWGIQSDLAGVVSTCPGNTSQQNLDNSVIDGFGVTGLAVATGSDLYVMNTNVQDNVGHGGAAVVNIAGGGSLWFVGGYNPIGSFSGPGGTNAVIRNQGGTLLCSPCIIYTQGSGWIGVRNDSGTVNFVNSVVAAEGAGSIALYNVGASSFANARDTEFFASTSAIAIDNVGTLVDNGGNTVINSGVSSFGTVLGIQSATGTALATSNIGLTSGWGTSSVSAVGANSDSRSGTFTITGAGSPSANPQITLTFPTPYPFVAPKFCTLQQIAGNLGEVTVPLNASGTPSTTAVIFTLAGTAVAAHIYTFSYVCS